VLVQYKRRRRWDILGHFGTLCDSTCNQSKPQKPKATQNKLTLKCNCTSSSSFAQFLKIQLKSASILINALAISLFTFVLTRAGCQNYQAKRKTNNRRTLTKALFQNLYAIELPQNSHVPMPSLPKN
jgi:hypothetical protein